MDDKRFLKFAALTGAALLMSASAALAQLATSPEVDEVVLPDVEVTSQPQSAPRRSRQPKAPAAAQQSSTPRKTNTVAPVERAPAAPTAAPAADVVSVENSGPQQSPDTSDVTVAPTGLTTSVDRIANSVSVVTSKEIEAQQRRTVPDVLRALPGINVVQSGGPGALTSIFVRGTNSNHVKVIIDGIDVSDPSSANRSFDFGQLQSYDIDRVELLRGPQSGLYGADALGGVIAIYTKKGNGPAKVNAIVEGGSFGTFNQAVGASGSEGAFNYAFNIGHQRVDGVPVTPGDYGPAATPRFDNAWENWTFSTKLGFDVSQDITINAVARYTDSQLDFTGDGFDFATGNSVPNPFQSQTDTEQFYTRGEVVVRSFGGAMTSFFGVNYTDVSTDNLSPDPFFAQRGLNDGQRVRTDWRSVVQVAPGYTIVAGADWQREELDSRNVDPFSTTRFAAEEESAGVYGQVDGEIVQNWFVTGNLRYDSNENFDSATTWRVASAYILEATGTKFKASYGTAFKAPSLSQRFQDFLPFFVANRNLQPEESDGFDAGFEQAVFNDRAQFGATYFHNDITNLVQFATDPVTFVGTLENIGKATTEGVEVFASADITDDIRLRADYTFTEAIDEDLKQDLLRRPRHKASLTAGWTPIDPLLLSATLLYIGETADVDRATFARVELPSFFLVNVAADYKLNDNLALFGRVDNVFDEDYENPDGFLGPGVAAYAGLRLTN